MNIAASGGSSTILCHASRTRNYTWNGVGTTYTETENGSPTLSKSGDGTLNGTTSGSITVKLIRNNNPNDACKLTGFTDINTHTKTSVGLEEDKTVIRTFVTSYIQTLPINLCKVTFKYAELNFRVFIAKDTGN